MVQYFDREIRGLQGNPRKERSCCGAHFWASIPRRNSREILIRGVVLQFPLPSTLAIWVGRSDLFLAGEMVELGSRRMNIIEDEPIPFRRLGWNCIMWMYIVKKGLPFSLPQPGCRYGKIVSLFYSVQLPKYNKAAEIVPHIFVRFLTGFYFSRTRIDNEQHFYNRS